MKKTLTPHEVADFFRVSKRTIQNWVNEGVLQATTSKPLRISRESILFVLSESTTPSED